MEDGADSILSYEGNEIKPRKGNDFVMFGQKKRKIAKLADRKDSIIRRYFSDDLMERIMVWVNRRNFIIHALLKQKTTAEDLKSFAEEGEALVKELRNTANNYKHMVERRKK